MGTSAQGGDGRRTIPTDSYGAGDWQLGGRLGGEWCAGAGLVPDGQARSLLTMTAGVEARGARQSDGGLSSQHRPLFVSRQ